MENLATLLQLECDRIPEAKEFKSLMNNFFIGKVEFINNTMHIPDALNITEEISDEIETVIENYREYPDDENLQSLIFTQEINKECLVFGRFACLVFGRCARLVFGRSKP